MRENTHKHRLIDYLNTHGSITTLEAFIDLGNTRLAATIFHLKKELEGSKMYIETSEHKVPTRFLDSDGKRKYTIVAKYTLKNLDNERA